MRTRHPLERLYEDEAVRVEACLLDTNTLVFSFNSYSGVGATDGLRVGFPFLPENGFSSIYITARRSHWWQMPDQTSFIAAIAPHSHRYRRRIAYGSSMGGYGALLFASELDATGVVAFVPQTVIGKPEYGLRPIWKTAIDKVTITKDDIFETIGLIPDVRLFYDPRDPMDRAFIDYLGDAAAIQHYTLPFFGHKIQRVLAEMGIISEVVTAALNGAITPCDVRARSRALRLNSARYRAALARRLADRSHSALRIDAFADREA